MHLRSGSSLNENQADRFCGSRRLNFICSAVPLLTTSFLTLAYRDAHTVNFSSDQTAKHLKGNKLNWTIRSFVLFL